METHNINDVGRNGSRQSVSIQGLSNPKFLVGLPSKSQSFSLAMQTPDFNIKISVIITRQLQ